MNNDEEKDTSFIVVSILVTIVIIGLWILTYFLLKDMPDTQRGTFGDMFGSVNALFSGLALAGIVLTILLQRKELKLQREELRDTRKEFETQNETLKIQRFENTFFNLLDLHHQIVAAIDYRYNKRIKDQTEIIINGRDVFRYLYKNMVFFIRHDPDNSTAIYKEHYEAARLDFGHYFRNLYRMIKLVDETDFFYDINKVSAEDAFKIKYRYTSIIRAQLSDYELLWLFYNCLSENGIEKFKPLIERYVLFKNLTIELLATENHANQYSSTAYKVIN